MTIAGDFGTGDPVRAVAGASTRSQSSVQLTERNGRSYAVIDQQFYFTQLEPGLLGLAQNYADLDGAISSGPGIAERGGTLDDWVFVKTSRPKDVLSTASLLPSGDTFVLTTTDEKKQGSFNSTTDRAAARLWINSLVTRVRQTPLAPAADAIERTNVVFHGNRAQTRTVLPKSVVQEVIRNAALSQRHDWDPLLPPSAQGSAADPPTQRQARRRTRRVGLTTRVARVIRAALLQSRLVSLVPAHCEGRMATIRRAVHASRVSVSGRKERQTWREKNVRRVKGSTARGPKKA
jgi:hypothetical protein